MTDQTTTEGRSFERPVLRVRINRGALVSQDRAIGRWPETRAGENIDPDMVFDAEWSGRWWWECRADGFGRLRSRGETGGYGNGSIFVHSHDGVTVVDELQNTAVVRPDVCEATTKSPVASGTVRITGSGGEFRSGKTTRQMMEAPANATFVWPNSNLAIPRSLARFLGREDLVFISAGNMEPRSLIGTPIHDLVVDHSVCASDIREALDFLELHGTRITWP